MNKEEFSKMLTDPCGKTCRTCRTHQIRRECMEPKKCWRLYGSIERYKIYRPAEDCDDNWEWDGMSGWGVNALI